MRALFAAFVLLAAVGVARAAGTPVPQDTRFVAIAFHDVVDSPRDLAGDAMTTDALVGFLEWIVASGLHPVTLDDVDAARRGVRALPERAILLTFDDGYRSLYTRVYPLLLAYRIPAVATLVGEWMEPPMDGSVRYGGELVPRRRFVSWAEAREMAGSGLVEFASHGYGIHGTVRANPQGSERPAATAPLYDPATGYETYARYRERIVADLARSRALMREHLGKPPRAFALPYGRYRTAATESARAAGFEFVFTLDSEPADAMEPLQLARYLPTGNPTLGDLVGALRSLGSAPRVSSVVCVDPGGLAGNDLEERLGRSIERIRALGTTAVAIDAFERDAEGRAVAAWLPTTLLPMRMDVLSRVAWQLHTRAGVEIYLRVPAFSPSTLTPARLATLAQELAAATEIDGLVFETAARFEPATSPSGDVSWAIRARRAALDASGLTPAQQEILAVFRAVEQVLPTVKLVLVERGIDSRIAIADLTFAGIREGDPAPATGAVEASRRFGPWITGREGPPDARFVQAVARDYKMRGAMAAGWCPDDPAADRPAAAVVAPATSASRTPKRP